MKTTHGNAQLVSMRDGVYKENYHIIMVKWEDGRNTAIVLDDDGKPLNPTPYSCWEEIKRVLTSQ